MFILEIAGVRQLFWNALEDDFLSSVPENFDVEPHEVQAYFIPEAQQKLIRRLYKLNPNNLFHIDLDLLKIYKIMPPKFELGHTETLNQGTEAEVVKAYDINDPECRPTLDEVLDFTVQKVLEVKTKSVKNSISGVTEIVQDRIVLSETQIVDFLNAVESEGEQLPLPEVSESVEEPNEIPF